jgi:trans-2,3-dihydro-3-hydroxyanthranilate isomerase
MPRRYRFRQVDVFTDRPLAGNPLAVFVEAEGLDDDEMQAIAREMNISETCFVLPPSPAGAAEGADYRLRIFTPKVELPFAGHPALGAAWVLADAGRFELRAPVTEVRQELAIGVLPLSLRVLEDEHGRPAVGEITMTQGRVEEIHHLDEDETAELCEAMEVSTAAIGWPGAGRGRSNRAAPAVISTGLPHLIVPFLDRAVMADIDPELSEHVAEVCSSFGCESAALIAPGNSGVIADADISVRLFDASELGIGADPATGAAAGPIAVFLGQVAGAHAVTQRVVIEQGTELGRPSRLQAEADFGPDGRPGEVRVAGTVVPLVEGRLTLPDGPVARVR